MPVVAIIVALLLFAQSAARTQPPNAIDPATGAGLSNPYQAGVRNWATLPDGGNWGSTAGIEKGPHGEVWAIGRCGANSCDGSSLPPVHLLDMQTGKPLRSIGAGLFVFPHGLHVDIDGNVWVTDGQTSKDATKGQQVIKLSPNGDVLMRLGTAGVSGGGPNHFNEPCDVITAPNGDIFVADGHSGQMPATPSDYVSRIVKFARDGRFITQWGRLGSGPGEFKTPHALAIDARGRLFVGDRGNRRIQIFDLNGTFLEEWTHYGRPSGLFFDQADRLYAIDATSSATDPPVWKRGTRIGNARTGQLQAFVPGHETANPNGDAGEGIVIDAAGNLYAAENILGGITKYAHR